MFLELTYSELMAIGGGVAIYIGLMTVVQGLES